MITGIRDVFYNVQDMNRALEFYQNTLGLKTGYVSEYWTSLLLDGVNIGLHWTGGQKVPHVPRDSHGSHAGATLTLKSDNIAEDRMRIEQGGGKVLGEADEHWGHMLVFEDLDGNVLKLMKPK